MDVFAHVVSYNWGSGGEHYPANMRVYNISIPPKIKMIKQRAKFRQAVKRFTKRLGFYNILNKPKTLVFFHNVQHM